TGRTGSCSSTGYSQRAGLPVARVRGTPRRIIRPSAFCRRGLTRSRESMSVPSMSEATRSGGDAASITVGSPPPVGLTGLGRAVGVGGVALAVAVRTDVAGAQGAQLLGALRFARFPVLGIHDVGFLEGRRAAAHLDGQPVGAGLVAVAFDVVDLQLVQLLLHQGGEFAGGFHGVGARGERLAD